MLFVSRRFVFTRVTVLGAALAACAEGSSIGTGGVGGESTDPSGSSRSGQSTSTSESQSSSVASSTKASSATTTGATTTSATTTSATTTSATNTTASSSGTGGGDCGNGAIDVPEQCDAADLGNNTCTTIGDGFVGGSLACSANCTFDTSACQAPPTCGNQMIDAGEDCEPQMLGGASCLSVSGLSSGTLSCSAACQFDTSGCYQCNNGTLSGPEVCDGQNLGGKTCVSLGHDGGQLQCGAGCLTFQEGGCSDCGDSIIEGLEVCDQQNLGGHSCQSLGFSGGILTCNADCSLNLTQCTGQTCGNGVREGTEVCDLPDLAGQTCVTQGFVGGGNLGCAANCSAFNTAGCVSTQCSDALDNDMDGFVDGSDPGCSGPSDNDEILAAPNCNGVGGPIFDVTFADLSFDVVVTGSTAGGSAVFAPTDLSGDCNAQSSSREVILRYRNAVQQPSITFTLNNPGTNFDTVLYVRGGACNSANEVCNDDFGLSIRSSLTLTNVAPGDLFIFIDGFASQTGDYELLIDLPN